jgi:hypothetical protein
MEKRISSACLHEKFVRHGQRATLVGLQRNFLRFPLWQPVTSK